MATASCFSAFDRTSPDAVKWAERRSASLVKGINDEARAAIRIVIKQSYVDGIDVKNTAKLIQQTIGLSENQTKAVLRLRQTLIQNPGRRVWAGKTPIRVPKGGISPAQLEKAVSRYADRLLRQRATLIARTETIAASNEGQLQVWKQAVKNGELTDKARRVWITAASERTCPTCLGLDGETVGLNDTFSVGVSNPPAHPRCRCSVGLVA